MGGLELLYKKDDLRKDSPKGVFSRYVVHVEYELCLVLKNTVTNLKSATDHCNSNTAEQPFKRHHLCTTSSSERCIINYRRVLRLNSPAGHPSPCTLKRGLPPQRIQMKGGQNLRELQQRKEEAEGWVKPKPCIVCQKVIAGAYGRDSEDNWTCNSQCERSYRDSLPRTAAAETR